MTDHPALTPLSATRTAPKTFTLRNDRGAELEIGMAGAEGSFTPGELLQAAVAGCAALSAEAQFAHQLGPDYEASASVSAAVDEDDDRIDRIAVTLAADMAELSPEDRDRLISRAERVIDRLCTVKRSVNHGITATARVTDDRP